jgi:hypothetical protein
MIAANKRYSYPRVAVIQIDVHPAGENPINKTHMVPTLVHICLAYTSCGQSPSVAIFHESSIELSRTTAPEKKGSRHNLQHAGRLTRGFVPIFSPEPTNEAVGAKSSIYRPQATRLTGSISPACDRYIQYLLAGANTSVLNRHRWGLQPCRCRLINTTLKPSQPTILHFSPNGPARSQVIHPNITNWNKEGTNHKSREWDFSTRLLPSYII